MDQQRRLGNSAKGQSQPLPANDSDDVQRQQIAEATCRVISRGGLGDATFRRIATELGATTGLISHYFTTKADLLNYTITYAQQRLSAQGLSLEWSSKEAFIEDLCKALSPANRAATMFWQVWIAYLGVALIDDDVRAEYVTWDDLSRQQLRSFVATELGDEATSADIELVADALNALATGIGVLALLDTERLTTRRVRSILLQSFEAIIGAARDTNGPARSRRRTRDRT